MDITRDQQIELDDALVAPANRLKIADVQEIYMEEFWATAIVHHHSICFKMNNKKHIVNLEYFREMLQICPKLPDQQFEEIPFEEEILMFPRDLGHSGEIKVITDVNVNKLHQPWRSFAAVINKCLSGFINSKKKQGKLHFASDDLMFTTIKVVSRHEDTQLYGAILLDELTNKAIKDPESYKEYYAIASGAEPPKIKASVRKKHPGSDKTKTPPTAKGKRLKTSAKAAKLAKKKQPAKSSKAKGLTVLSEVALTEAEQMELATKRSLIQTHSSHSICSASVKKLDTNSQLSRQRFSDEEDDDEVAMSGDDDDDADNQDDDDNDDDDQNDDNTDNENDDNDDDDDDGQDHEGPDDDNKQTDSDNDGDDFVHPKFSTHDEEDNEEEGSDLRVQTPSHYESTNDEESDEVTHGANIKGEELDEEVTKEEEKANELYRDVNVNLEGRDTEMTDAPRTIIQTTQVIEDTHVIITPVNPEGQQQSSSVSSGFVSNMFNPIPDTGIDSIFNLNAESTSLVDVPVTTIAEPPLSSTTTLPPPTIPLITHLQQTPAPTLTTVLNEAQAENEDFINKLDDNIKKIIKDQVKEDVKEQVSKILPKIEKTVNEQLEAEVLSHSSNESKTSHAIAANLFEFELKKILIDNMENTVSFKRRQDDENKDEEPSVGSDRGSKRRRARKEPESTSAVTSENFSNSE
ncbi:hypothetical protein Tco_0861375 [Tanacetum coccineum]|uniref:Uncharacterized protein n=1 Tax=Tanacetum coccineum TaxID=301880 RepID=A0ABQ5BIE7_9ASTR